MRSGEGKLEEEVARVLARVKTSLEGADVRLVGINEGVVTVQYLRPISGLSCHRAIAGATRKQREEMDWETISERLRQEISGVKEVIIIQAGRRDQEGN